jgi:SAM-dependent methyltransferase
LRVRETSDMGFDVTAEAYDRFMGRYSGRLAEAFAAFAGVEPGHRVLDVGCGPGALTRVLVERLGAGSVAAADPSPPFVAAIRERFPHVDVCRAAAEALPFADGAFDASLAQLVVHFMSDPVAALREMARVAGRDGVVAACVWDFEGARAPISVFWTAAQEVVPSATGEAHLAGARAGDLAELFGSAGLGDVVSDELTVVDDPTTFDEWWEPLTFGVGPAGAYAKTLDVESLAAIRDRCRESLPGPTFQITATAWAARGRGR